ncbi:MAG: hypothetical protein R3E76_11290 [Planctomycetota bacterium]
MRTSISCLLLMLLALSTVRAQEDPKPEPATEAKPSAENAAEAFKFMVDKDADRFAEMRKLKPTTEDYRLIFVDDFAATAEEKLNKGWWDSLDDLLDIIYQPNDHDSVEAWVATSDEIKEWKGSAKAHFPTGIRRLREKLKPGVTHAALRTYKAGGQRTRVGMGLVWVKNRWVFMVLPWNLLRDHTSDYPDDFEVAEDSLSFQFSGDKDGATELLKKFMEKEADLSLLTNALRPRKQDIEAVYKDAAAAHYLAYYKAQYDSNPAIFGKPEQTELSITVLKTDDVIAWTDEAYEVLPGGYQKVKDYLNAGVPIVRFKFVKPGETLGMAYDGLFYVNKRWVFMPKPWRKLPG